MGLKYGLDGALIGFIDCMFGFATFVYLNIQEYRHMRVGTFEEVVLSYTLGAYGFFKGLGLCITTAQAMVINGRSTTARLSCVVWFILSIFQIGFISVLLYYFLYPMNAQLGSDIFLFVVRIIHVAFLLASAYFIYSLWSEIGALIPRISVPRTRKESTKSKQPSKVHWNLKRAHKKTRTSAAHTDPTPPEAGTSAHEMDGGSSDGDEK